MTTNGNIFCVTGLLWGESTGQVAPVEPEQMDEQAIEKPVIWDAIALIMTSP